MGDMDSQNLASSSSPRGGATVHPFPQQDAWINSYRNLLPHWQSLAPTHQSVIPFSISRVNQVDAGRLDIEMSAMLKEQLVKVFSLMKECYFNMNQNLMLSLSF